MREQKETMHGTGRYHLTPLDPTRSDQAFVIYLGEGGGGVGRGQMNMYSLRITT